VAGILVGRGMLDPEEYIVSYLPELKHTAWKDARLRHALDMTSGVRYTEDYEAPDSDIAITDIASGWKLPQHGVTPAACIWDQILTLETKAREHGELFEYRSIESDVLAHCMERVTRTRLAELISTELWQPLGCEESACFTVDAAGYALADGGFNATLRDYARFGQMLANGGIGNGQCIVPTDWLDDTLDCDPGLYQAPYNDICPNGAYRNQFWIRNAERRVVMARGVFGQLIYVDMDNDLVVVKLSSWPEFLSTMRRKDELAAIDEICSHLSEINHD
jgi:CubicO group peptidase (beta-lactamase class C family)